MSSNDTYYGSDLNEYASTVLDNDTAIINIDMAIHKRAKGKIWLIEYKHQNEHMNDGQEEILRKLGWAFSKINKLGLVPFELDQFVVTGDKPYDNMIIKSWCTRKTIETHGREEFIKWLKMEQWQEW